MEEEGMEVAKGYRVEGGMKKYEPGRGFCIYIDLYGYIIINIRNESRVLR